MKRLLFASSVAALATAFVFFLGAASPKRVFTGTISDDMCGFDHSGMSNGADDRACTLGCVAQGAQFVLADRKAQRVYDLDDQKRPREFAGERVKITGTLEGDTIRVKTIAKSS
jgi:Protein of unknown function (DUF5818)